jgi:SAM-dependent methyltransferase
MQPETPSHDRIMQIGFGFWPAKTLLTAISLGVFTELAKEACEAEMLCSRLGLHPRSARDFFDALVALKFLERDGQTYRNGPEADLYLDRAKPTYIGGILEMANSRLYGFWDKLGDALKSGEPQNETQAGDPDLFEAIYADPKTLESFLGGMTGISRPIGRAVAAAFPWRDVKSFADIGCAQGGFSSEIAAAHPHLAGTGMDLAPVGPIFQAYARAQGVDKRLSFQTGDFFREPLPSADVLIMGHILHDWDLTAKRRLLAKALAALPAGGALIVYDAMIDDDRKENLFGLMMSLNMAIETRGGFDYTGADCIGWMREAGFRDAKTHRLSPTHSMVVGRK